MLRSRDPEFLTVFLLAIGSIVEALLATIILVLAFQFIPLSHTAFYYDLFPIWQRVAMPERELFFYRFFVMLCVGLQVVGLFCVRHCLKNGHIYKDLGALILADVCWLGVQLFAVFKIFLLDASWARALLVVAAALSIMMKFFWPEIRKTAGFARTMIGDANAFRRCVPWLDCLVPLGIVAVVFMPDLGRAVDIIFKADAFNHLDSFIMAPAWAWMNGRALGAEAANPSCSVVPIMVAQLSRICGGLSYEHAVGILMVMTILYCVGFYVLLRIWLRSALVAAIGALLAVKLQLFHWGAAYVLWQNPELTVARYFMDLPVLLCLATHLRRLDTKYLWTAAGFLGLALAYSLDTGLGLALGFYVYLLLAVVLRQSRILPLEGWKDWFRVFGYVVLPWAVAGCLAFIIQGPSILSVAFWCHAGEQAALKAHGLWAVAFTSDLKIEYFFAFFMGIAVCLVFAGTLMMAGALFVSTISREFMLAAALSVYGLALFTPFVGHAILTNYDANCFPFVGVVCFWLSELIRPLGIVVRRVILGALAVWTGTALMTNFLMTTYYPNIFNAARSTKAVAADVVSPRVYFQADALLVRQLTSPGDAVPVISSFETAILIGAERKPFFYDFPLMYSQPMDANRFGGFYLYTPAALARTLQKIETEKPRYIFVERTLYEGRLPEAYYANVVSLRTILVYLMQNYEPERQGQYLIALKRK